MLPMIDPQLYHGAAVYLYPSLEPTLALTKPGKRIEYEDGQTKNCQRVRG